jgi:Transposase IS116/IS110/IS902 family
VLALAPTPEQGRRLTRAAVRRALVGAGRRRNLEARVVAVHDALAAPQLAAPEPVAAAYREVVGALVAVLRSLSGQVAALEEQLASQFGAHPDAAILRSQPGLGVVLGARVLAEFGDDPHRYATAKGRKAFAGTAPVTRSSGLRTVVVARAECNQRLVDACYLWAFAALTASPGARRCYDAHRARGATHHQALRALGNRLVGILHGCLAGQVAYQEQIAWPTAQTRCLTTAAGGAGGCNPPAILADWIARGAMVQVRRRCREVKARGERRWPSVGSPPKAAQEPTCFGGAP